MGVFIFTAGLKKGNTQAAPARQCF